MLDPELLKSARKGNLDAVASLVQQALSDRSVISVNARLETGWLTLDLIARERKPPKDCKAIIIEILNEIDPPWGTVIVSWNVNWVKSTIGFLTKKKGKYVDPTSFYFAVIMAIIFGLSGCVWYLFSLPVAKPPAEVRQQQNLDCLYVPESTIAGMDSSAIARYKEQLKRQTGKNCIFFTGR